MWRINAAAALVSVGIRGILVREAFPDGKGDATTAPLCFLEIAFIAVLGIEQPFKWWIALIFLVAYFLFPAIVKVALSDEHVHRLAARFDEETIQKIESAINVSLLEFGIAGSAVAVLAIETGKRDENKPWISLAFAIAITTLTFFLAFKPNTTEIKNKFQKMYKMDTFSKNNDQANDQDDILVQETAINARMGHGIARLRF